MYKFAQYARTLITYQWASRAAMFWIICEFTRFLLAKTKRVRRLFNMSCISPARKTYSLGVSRYGKTFLATGARLILSHRGTIFRFALQNYTKKTTYARDMSFFCLFFLSQSRSAHRLVWGIITHLPKVTFGWNFIASIQESKHP